mmetsp:Transcript_22431/g.56076  ORF Transcript_22431/g.56076 Transcript_22431/m.56076 type:complete len:203 (+) Transcript_22431:294-902(+)
MLKLRGTRSIQSRNGPSITPHEVLVASYLNHWFDGEDVAYLHQPQVLVCLVVNNLWAHVKNSPHSMPAKILGGGETSFGDIVFNDGTNGIVGYARLADANRSLPTVVCHLKQRFGFSIDLPNAKHLTVVPVKAPAPVIGFRARFWLTRVGFGVKTITIEVPFTNCTKLNGASTSVSHNPISTNCNDRTLVGDEAVGGGGEYR